MVSRNGATNSTPEVSGAKGRSDLDSIQIPRHFDIINGSIICDKFESMDWIASLPLKKKASTGGQKGRHLWPRLVQKLESKEGDDENE